MYLGFCIKDLRSLKSLSLCFYIFILSIWRSVFSMWGFWSHFWFYVPCFEKCLAYSGQGVRSMTLWRVCVSEFEFVVLGSLCSRYEVPENLWGCIFRSFNLSFFFVVCAQSLQSLDSLWVCVPWFESEALRVWVQSVISECLRVSVPNFKSEVCGVLWSGLIVSELFQICVEDSVWGIWGVCV